MDKRSRISDNGRAKRKRGMGIGINYSPWVHVQDFSSRGLSARILGRTTGRIHHLLSRLEANLFYVLDYSKTIDDIREQYPLDLGETKEIARTLGVRHPDNGGDPKVMTTDFFVVLKNGSKAISTKYAKDLTSRALDKLEIERQYWERRNIPWHLITENELPCVLIDNILQLREFNVRPYIKITDAELLDHLAMTQDDIKESLTDLAARKKESFANLKMLFCFLVNSGRITFDISAKEMMELNRYEYEVIS